MGGASVQNVQWSSNRSVTSVVDRPERVGGVSSPPRGEGASSRECRSKGSRTTMLKPHKVTTKLHLSVETLRAF
jgi:hypothetical protein